MTRPGGDQAAGVGARHDHAPCLAGWAFPRLPLWDYALEVGQHAPRMCQDAGIFTPAEWQAFTLGMQNGEFNWA